MRRCSFLIGILLGTVCLLSSPAHSASAPDLVRLSAIDPTIRQEMRYAGTHNFTGRPVDGYAAPQCWLTREAATALSRVQTEARTQGYRLKVYDCYRPTRAVAEFMRWAEDPADQAMKAEFYPAVDKQLVFQEGYIAEKSGHSRGSTMDLTLVPLHARPEPVWRLGMPLQACTNPRRHRYRDNSIDMGTGFDCFDPKAHTDAPALSARARRNRQLLRTLMAHQGFKNYPKEWWHYTLINEPYPDRYFDTPVD